MYVTKPQITRPAILLDSEAISQDGCEGSLETTKGGQESTTAETAKKECEVSTYWRQPRTQMHEGTTRTSPEVLVKG